MFHPTHPSKVIYSIKASPHLEGLYPASGSPKLFIRTSLVSLIISSTKDNKLVSSRAHSK